MFKIPQKGVEQNSGGDTKILKRGSSWVKRWVP